MSSVTAHEAKSTLSKPLAATERGEGPRFVGSAPSRS